LPVNRGWKSPDVKKRGDESEEPRKGKIRRNKNFRSEKKCTTERRGVARREKLKKEVFHKIRRRRRMETSERRRNYKNKGIHKGNFDQEGRKPCQLSQGHSGTGGRNSLNNCPKKEGRVGVSSI